MQQLKSKHPDINLGAIGQDAVLYYEDNSNDSIFSSKQSYNLDKTSSDLDEDRPTSIHFIPIPGTRKEPMYGHLAEIHEILNETKGVMAYRIGESLSEEGFIVLTQWAKTSTYNDFKQTNNYKNYFTAEALNKHRTAEALFHKSVSSKLYLPLKDNAAEEDEF
ncbi:hypothetical protein ACFOU0_05770 [Salinicoccus sesuvii]|uniref:Signal transduction protein TRAP n=2 Tax=Salinicoccus sesuvii TaxID=868281 RepID=A0ABV7N697_9STAP